MADKTKRNKITLSLKSSSTVEYTTVEEINKELSGSHVLKDTDLDALRDEFDQELDKFFVKLKQEQKAQIKQDRAKSKPEETL